MLLDETLSRWDQGVIDVERFLAQADTSDDRVTVQEGEICQSVLAEPWRVHGREEGLHFARSLRVQQMLLEDVRTYVRT